MTDSKHEKTNSVSNELSESDSSDDDIIIDRTDESNVKAHLQPSEDIHMEVDATHQSDDREYMNV